MRIQTSVKPVEIVIWTRNPNSFIFPNPNQTDLKFEPQRYGDTEGETRGGKVWFQGLFFSVPLCLCASVVQNLRDNSPRFGI